MTPQELALIREEIRKQLFIILGGRSGANTVEAEDITEYLPGAPTMEKRPVMHPYGFASRAPEDTVQVTARYGDQASNRIVLGHRAADRPEGLEQGESAVYSSSGYGLSSRADRVEGGQLDDPETLVAGETLLSMLSQLLDLLVQHVHGPPGSPPINASQFQTLKTNFLQNAKILLKQGGRY
jgi:hypothetical protein